MTKGNDISKIDFAIESTIKKGGKNKSVENVFTQLRKYILESDSKGFTRENGARNSICSLSMENVIKEMLKNTLKVGKINDNQGYATLFKNNINYDDPKMTLETAEEYINNLVLENQKNIDMVFQALLEHPVLLNGLISSFVVRRYYDSRYRKILDNPDYFDDTINNLCKNIDSYSYNDMNGNSLR